jgi:hypothetical protein
MYNERFEVLRAVSYALVETLLFDGAKETPRTSCVISRWVRALSIIVGIVVFTSGERECFVRAMGPTPMIPSTPLYIKHYALGKIYQKPTWHGRRT